MKGFVLVDFVTQRAEVSKLLAGRSVPEIVAWLGTFGVATVRMSGPRQVIDFRSPSGRSATFFVEGDTWVFIGDGTTFI
jgi:hypothetical protein